MSQVGQAPHVMMMAPTMPAHAADDAAADENAAEISSSCSSSSADTNAALLDMLGISPDDFDFEHGDGEGRGIADADADAEIIGTGIMDDGSTTAPQPIDLPARCSRYLHPPTSCCAFLVPSILSPAECRYVIHRATRASSGTHPTTAASDDQQTSPNKGFHYVTEASHTDDGGNSVRVKLQNPNPHKLAVYQDADFLDRVVWRRLRHHLELESMEGAGGGLGMGSGHHGGGGHGHHSHHHHHRHHRPQRHVDEFYKRTGCGQPLGLNPRVRVLKYDADDDDRFEPHFDATTRGVAEGTTSLLTVLVYLNDGGGTDFDGGETLYLDSHVSNLNVSANESLDGPESAAAASSTTRIVPRAGTAVIFEHDLYHSGSPLTWGTKYVLRTDVMFDSSVVGIDSAAGCRRRREGRERARPSSNDDDGGEEEGASVAAGGCERAAAASEATSQSIADLAVGAGLSVTERDCLDGMGILHVTPETFLGPGVAVVRMMLVDVGVAEERVDALMERAIDAVGRNN